MSEKQKINSVLFVCLGNICRSPTAHAIFRSKATEVKLPTEYDSAGTAGYHVGAKPDKRSRKHGERRGYDFNKLHARAVSDDDFEDYDLLLAMDKSNYHDLMERCPSHYQHKIKLFLDYALNYPDVSEVPDPYYGGDAGFEYVLDLVEDGCNGLIQAIQNA